LVAIGFPSLAQRFFQLSLNVLKSSGWAMHFEEIRTHQCLALEAGLIVGPQAKDGTRAPLSQAELAF